MECLVRVASGLVGVMTVVVALCSGSVTIVSRKDSTNMAVHENVTSLLGSLLTGYDIRLRPQFGGDPLHIDMEIILASFDSISEVNMDYTVTIYLNQYWRDERLAFSNNFSDVMTLTGDFSDKIWVPDTFFANDKDSFLHEVTEKNKKIRLHGDGYILYGMRFTTKLACMMDLHYYPLDNQNCTIEVESYGYPMEDVVMAWRGDSPADAVHGVWDVEIPQFTIVEFRTVSTVEVLATGKYQRLSLSFRLQRNIGYFIFQTYLPSILIVMLSWVSFWINHEATSARVALGITTVLTMTTISTGVRSSLPRISYVKAIDIYLVMCFVFVFAALLEYAAVNYTYWGARAKRKTKRPLQYTDRDNDAYNNSQTPMASSIVSDNFIMDGRESPIASLRKRPGSHNYDSHLATASGTILSAATQSVSTTVSTPTFRVQISYPTSLKGRLVHLRRRNMRTTGGTSLAPRFAPSGDGGVSVTSSRRLRTFDHVKRKACHWRERLPRIEDVNKIDQYSRIVFPLLFVVFNLCYWCFYALQA